MGFPYFTATYILSRDNYDNLVSFVVGVDVVKPEEN